ncbi:MAG: hypothetical protein DMF80_05310 [Acidobacteria bacterium]|nr:MAG: hypothetical protein DMF80_05310 [Acidobacteriota bacterium]
MGAAGAVEDAESETGLLEKARGGSLPAFEEIVRRYQRRVYATAYRIVRRHEVADDVAQEAFIRAHRSLDRFDAARPFGPWICRIAANLAVNRRPPRRPLRCRACWTRKRARCWSGPSRTCRPSSGRSSA